MNKSAQLTFYFVLILTLLISSCTPAQPAATAMSVDPSQTENTSQPAQQAIPPTATIPVAQQVDLPFTKLAFEKLAVPNDDGTFTNPYFETGGDFGIFNYPEMPSYIWHINPKSGLPVQNIIVNFDVYATVGDIVSGYDRAGFVALYNLNPIIDGQAENAQTVSTMGIIRNPRFSEWMDRYADIETDPNGVRHFTVTIPYEQFLGGKTDLVVQFLPGTIYSEPAVTAEGVFPDSAAVPEILAADPDVVKVDHSWLDAYWSGNHSLMIEDGPSNFSDFGYDGNHCPILAVEYGLEHVAFSDYVLVPQAVESVLACANIAEDYLTTMRENMVDPQTGLVDGVWDADAPDPENRLIATDRVTSNILVASGFGFGNNWDIVEYQDPQSEQFLYQMLVNGIDQEIVMAPNGKWIFAPAGFNEQGETIIDLDDLSIMVQEVYKGLRQTDLERADHLLEGYANTLQLVLEAQESTPANLLPDSIKITFSNDGTYTFDYLGDFNMANRFYYFWERNYEWYGNGLQSQISDGDIFNIEKLEYFAEMKPEDQPAELRTLYKNGQRFYNVQRISFYIYQIFYNIYSGADSIYAQYYSLNDRSPVYPEVQSEVEPWLAYRQHYGSVRSVINWVQLAAFFHDKAMLDEAYPILVKGMDIVEVYLPEQDPKYVDTRVWQAQQGLGQKDFANYLNMWAPVGMRVYRSDNFAPWGMNGAFNWRVTFDDQIELLEHQYKFNFDEALAADDNGS
jgi:hypothetical protein